MRNPNRETMFQFKRFSVENRQSAMKVGTDGVLLGAWATMPGFTANYQPHILDVGAGTGLISLMLAQRFPQAEIYAIEIDADSASECARNFSNSPWGERLHIVCNDFRVHSFKQRFDLIVSNPPFFNNGAKAPDDARHTARHDDSLPLTDLIQLSTQLLNPSTGTLAIIVPTDRLGDAEFTAHLAQLRLWRKTTITTIAGKQPRRVLLQFATSDVNLPNISEISNECLASSDGHKSPWHLSLVKDFYLNP